MIKKGEFFMKKEIGLIIQPPKEQCTREEMVSMWAKYIYKLWQIKQRIIHQRYVEKSRTRKNKE